jgi:pyridoxal phosphate enzyme (YggS family)
MTIQERVSELREQVRRHAGGRAVTVVAVSKYTTVECMREAYQAGLRDFGESRVQDALLKTAHFPPEAYPDLRWHFIGTLQTNKASKTVGRFSLIHSVDSVRLAEALSVANTAVERRQAILLQINSSPDSSRRGFTPEAAAAALPAILALPGLEPRGLMTMAPPEASLNADSQVLNRVFDGLRRLGERFSDMAGRPLPELSMGMSRDFPYALANGATIIRVGSALFQAG